MMKINACGVIVSSSSLDTAPNHKRTCNPYVTPNMIIEINGNELLPVATATIRYASYEHKRQYTPPHPQKPQLT